MLNQRLSQRAHSDLGKPTDSAMLGNSRRESCRKPVFVGGVLSVQDTQSNLRT
jgi:hypothetical protein